ncbi:hypothetical protein Tco_0351470 [Tanacetum coccineum]
MIKSSNGETPFSLTYGTEAVMTRRRSIQHFGLRKWIKASNNNLWEQLNLKEERRSQAAIQEATSKKRYGKNITTQSHPLERALNRSDMVYRSNEASHAKDGGKLGPKWEGPYEVKESLGKGAYKLKDRKGNDMPRKSGDYG